MTEVFWQAVLLLAGAFFCGGVIACGLKRRFYYKSTDAPVPATAAASVAAPTPDASQPKIEVAPRPAEGTRFEKALIGQPSAPEQPASAAPAPEPAPAAAPPSTPASEPAPAAAAPQPEPGIPRVSVSEGSGAPSMVADGGAAPSDDLTRIQGIDSVMQARLKELGIRRFDDVARLTTGDIKGLSQTLGLDARISLENWVGQAQVLATGGETHYSRRQDLGVPVPEAAAPTSPFASESTAATPEPAPEPAPAASAPEPVVATPEPAAPSNVIPMTPAVAPAEPAPAPAAEPAADGPRSAAHDVSYLRSVRSEALVGDAAPARALGDKDDLKRIRGVGVLIEKKLNSLGISHYEQIANWTDADIERISRILDFKGRIERESWIEQARILATGGQTEFSRRG